MRRNRCNSPLITAVLTVVVILRIPRRGTVSDLSHASTLNILSERVHMCVHLVATVDAYDILKRRKVSVHVMDSNLLLVEESTEEMCELPQFLFVVEFVFLKGLCVVR